MSNLFGSLGHTGRRVVLHHTLNTQTLMKTDEQRKKVLSKFSFVLGCIHSHPEPHAAREPWVGHPCGQRHLACTWHLFSSVFLFYYFTFNVLFYFQSLERETSISCSSHPCTHWLYSPVWALTWDQTCNSGALGQHSNQLSQLSGASSLLLNNFCFRNENPKRHSQLLQSSLPACQGEGTCLPWKQWQRFS